MGGLSNFPPGVTGNEAEINGNREWEVVHDKIDEDATIHNLSDMDVECIWAIGLAAWIAAHKRNAKWPHE